MRIIAAIFKFLLIVKKPDKNGNFTITKKFEQYVKKWIDFDNSSGPLMKPKEKIKIIEKETKRETREIKQEDIVEFV